MTQTTKNKSPLGWLALGALLVLAAAGAGALAILAWKRRRTR